MSALRSVLLVGFLAVAAYANSVGNGFAYDDFHIIPQNPVVTGGEVLEALGLPYWPRALEGSGLYRPITVASFALEWRAFSGSPAGYHGLNILAHAVVSVLVFVLLLQFLPVAASFLGGAVFAVHPLHVEAVANVVGRAELYAALSVLVACLLYVRGRGWSGVGRYLRLLGLGACYAVGLGSKETAVTLPALLLLLELYHSFKEARSGRAVDWARDVGVYLLLAVVLAGYLSARYLVLGTVGGELPAPIFRDMDVLTRILTAVSVFPHYVRLLFFPVDLAVDYAPGVLLPAEGITPQVVLGALVLTGLGIALTASWRRAPLAAVGILWFCVAALPVSNLLFPTGVLLAERTLYIPSVGLAFLVGWAGAVGMRATLGARRAVFGAAAGVCVLFLLRTVDRNPTWLSTYTVLNTLAQEHPESYLSIRSRAMGLARVGEYGEAGDLYDLAALLAPGNYALLVEAGDFHGRRRAWGRAEPLLRRALLSNPRSPEAYRVLAGQLILQGRGRDGHRVALEGLARVGPDRELFALLSESYIAKGDLPAAIRARRAALGADPGSGDDWTRLGELLQAVGDTAGAEEARARSLEIGSTEEPSQ